MSEIPNNPVDSLDFPPEAEEEFKAMLGRVAGEFWGRDEVLAPGTRSLTTMAILCTRGLHEELAIHVRLGLEYFGVSREEICETIRHCALYSGFPVAVSGFRTVAKVFAEIDAENAAKGK